MFDESAGKLTLEQFIASIDSFFGLWRLDGSFREHILMYIATRDRIRHFVDSANLNPEVEQTFRSILQQLDDLAPIAGAPTNDDAYIDHLIVAEKLWHRIRPGGSDGTVNADNSEPI